MLKETCRLCGCSASMHGHYCSVMTPDDAKNKPQNNSISHHFWLMKPGSLWSLNCVRQTRYEAHFLILAENFAGGSRLRGIPRLNNNGEPNFEFAGLVQTPRPQSSAWCSLFSRLMKEFETGFTTFPHTLHYCMSRRQIGSMHCTIGL